MTDTDILKYAVQRELELTKKRSIALARQNWEVVIELEAKLDELALLRKKMTELPQIRDGLRVTGTETGRSISEVKPT